MFTYFAAFAVDGSSDPKIITLTLNQSKTDQFRSGANVCIAKTSTDLCPAALLSYIAVRRDKPGPLFIYQIFDLSMPYCQYQIHSEQVRSKPS